eukprot:scaffold133_cov257-Pinguiococcus_pyrenoidosus.AAC.18
MELSPEALQALEGHLQAQGAGVSVNELQDAQRSGGGRALRQLVAEVGFLCRFCRPVDDPFGSQTSACGPDHSGSGRRKR